MKYKYILYYKIKEIFKNLMVSILFSTFITFIIILISPNNQSQKSHSLNTVYSSSSDSKTFLKNTISDSSKNKSIKFTNNLNNYNYILSNGDIRSIVFDEYLKRNNSPLYGLGIEFVNSCEKYNAPKDCTLVLAIAKVETDLCNYKPSQAQKNCWGFGGAGENRFIFDSYTQGIDVVTYRLVEGYGIEYMKNPNKMELIYCGNRTTCKTWGEKVISAMQDINKLAIELGYPNLFKL